MERAKLSDHQGVGRALCRAQDGSQLWILPQGTIELLRWELGAGRWAFAPDDVDDAAEVRVPVRGWRKRPLPRDAQCPAAPAALR